jgi:hypothetical protein
MLLPRTLLDKQLLAQRHTLFARMNMVKRLKVFDDVGLKMALLLS